MKLGEIFSGVSPISLPGYGDVFVKHKSINDLIAIDAKREVLSDDLKKQGLKTEKELLSEAEKDDLWAESNELKIKKENKMIDNSMKLLQSLPYGSQRSRVSANIVDSRKRIHKEELKRNEIIKHGIETIIDNMVGIFLYSKSFFYDQQCQRPIFETEDDIYDEDITILGKHNYIQASICPSKNVDEFALRPEIYFGASRKVSPCEMFNRPYGDLTYNQINCVDVSNYFMSAFKNLDIPPGVADKPEKLREFIAKQTGDKKKGAMNKPRSNRGLPKKKPKQAPEKSMSRDNLLKQLQEKGSINSAKELMEDG